MSNIIEPPGISISNDTCRHPFFEVVDRVSELTLSPGSATPDVQLELEDFGYLFPPFIKKLELVSTDMPDGTHVVYLDMEIVIVIPYVREGDILKKVKAGDIRVNWVEGNGLYMEAYYIYFLQEGGPAIWDKNDVFQLNIRRKVEEDDNFAFLNFFLWNKNPRTSRGTVTTVKTPV